MNSTRIFGTQRGSKRIFRILYILIPIILASSGLMLIFSSSINSKSNVSDDVKEQIITLVRDTAENYFVDNLASNRSDLEIEMDWEVEIFIYHLGVLKEKGTGNNSTLSLSLEGATRNALNGDLSNIIVLNSRFLISILSPIVHSFIIYNEKGYEVIGGGLLPTRYLNKELIHQKIVQAKDYLYRMIDNKDYGVHKYYFALDDNFENRLHTIYTSSTIYSLLKIYDYTNDDAILQYALNCGEFILSMQNRNSGTIGYGAFHYSLFLKSRTTTEYYVVGTTSKTIFTLLMLYNKTGDNKYMESARLGADWLLTMQNPDGSILSWVEKTNGIWAYSTKESYLYSGQVLSALSRIYGATGKQEYYDAAQKIAQHFADIIDDRGYYLGDDYRSPNPISSSWVLLSLFDFYKISQDEIFLDHVINSSEYLIRRQRSDTKDLLNLGRWEGSYTTSGNGWLSEVMVEIYQFFKDTDLINSDYYKQQIINSIRWLIQHTYSEENSFLIKNPEIANGGLIWYFEGRELEVRTDSVCHGVNGYVGIIDDLVDGTLISIPQKTFEEMLNM